MLHNHPTLDQRREAETARQDALHNVRPVDERRRSDTRPQPETGVMGDYDKVVGLSNHHSFHFEEKLGAFINFDLR